MTDTEFAMLCLGIQIGALTMLLGQVLCGIRDDRRDRRLARAAQAQLDAARERAKA
ncbi:hypothetical protein ACFVZZ_18860 [Streptomyces chartreusis]|uniref:hypothetical protein n=1 Tax=Streptomyces chartreusis TaxID=1969 RepID=UPI0036D9836B